ncbi:MAG: polyprenyl synthetase family protein [Phycisphaeraceae bacterium]|nr:polyprenyl synthetase family protein [Phycisphaerae bacterium]MBX3392682.1 polyprenyl synthetase family protein [Phycisphaeraceae bacterium]
MIDAVRRFEGFEEVQRVMACALERVRDRFDSHLASDLPAVDRLVRHVEHYRGKMLRPMLVIAGGLATHPQAATTPGESLGSLIGDDHITAAAVCEMVHMATLVHDDVLDEADVRRGGRTVSRLHGNEAAVILGDLLIASAYHLCSQLDSQRSALLIGRVSMEMCSGELLQLHHRGDYSIDEATYFEIIRRKTGALIAASGELGAMHAGASPEAARAMAWFGSRLGLAFQIQDDVLDLIGREDVVGKSVGRDLAKSKLTLPVIHHLASADAVERGRSLAAIDDACREDAPPEASRAVRQRLDATGSIAHARTVAGALVAQARAALDPLAPTAAREALFAMADAAVDRAR